MRKSLQMKVVDERKVEIGGTTINRGIVVYPWTEPDAEPGPHSAEIRVRFDKPDEDGIWRLSEPNIEINSTFKHLSVQDTIGLIEALEKAVRIANNGGI